MGNVLLRSVSVPLMLVTLKRKKIPLLAASLVQLTCGCLALSPTGSYYYALHMQERTALTIILTKGLNTLSVCSPLLMTVAAPSLASARVLHTLKTS